MLGKLRTQALKTRLEAHRHQIKEHLRRASSQVCPNRDEQEGEDCTADDLLRAKMLEKLGRTEDALTRLGDGTYGLCSECEEEISVPRLYALPFAERCRDCQGKRESFQQGGFLSA